MKFKSPDPPVRGRVSLLPRNSLSWEEFARVEAKVELLSAFAQGLESTCSIELCVGAGVGIGDVAA